MFGSEPLYLTVTSGGTVWSFLLIYIFARRNLNIVVSLWCGIGVLSLVNLPSSNSLGGVSATSHMGRKAENVWIKTEEASLMGESGDDYTSNLSETRLSQRKPMYCVNWIEKFSQVIL